ncbi:MAG: helix-turn-helix domain-containing protein [Propionibacteriaceae bacterium]|nr:helix-turn-helix domain-containing protein [Propionibacteriaceae bacterium]
MVFHGFGAGVGAEFDGDDGSSAFECAYTHIYTECGSLVPMLSVAEAAEVRGVSPRRVRQLISAGSIPARRVGSTWVVDESAADLPPVVRRPLSSRSAWGLAVGVDAADWLSSQEKWRLKKRLAGLRGLPNRLAVFRSWMRGRGLAQRFRAPDPEPLLTDERVVPSGISDVRANMWAGGEYEVYLQPGQAKGVLRDHLLAPHPGGNVLIRQALVRLDVASPVLVAADLADHVGEREQRRALELLDEVIQ